VQLLLVEGVVQEADVHVRQLADLRRVLLVYL
jgi:hypothetical protein